MVSLCATMLSYHLGDLQMTDPELISAVLTSCGWEHNGWGHPVNKEGKSFYTIYGYDERKILTSLDACHEVFEKDAPDEYWVELSLLVQQVIYKYDYIGTLVISTLLGKATPRQRCLAWLRFKGVEIK